MTVEALRRRRPSTLADLLEAYGRELQAVAYLILRDRAEAEDVVIETLLTAFERGGDIRDERALRAWLLRVATNHALGRLRKTARLVRLDLSAEAAGPGDLASESTTRLSLLDGVDRLPGADASRADPALLRGSPGRRGRGGARQEPEHHQGPAPDRPRSTARSPCRTGRHQPRGGPPCMTDVESRIRPSCARRATT